MMHILKHSKYRVLIISIFSGLCLFLSHGLYAVPLNNNDFNQAKLLASDNSHRSAHPTSRIIKISKHRSNMFANNDKWVDIYRYHYPTDTTEVLIYNLKNNELIQSKRHQNLQLSATRDEIKYAARLLENDPAFMKQLATEYYQRYQSQLPSTTIPLSSLRVKAVILTSENVHNLPQFKNTKNCGLNRCIYFFLSSLEAPYTNVTLETKAIVNLSLKAVTAFNQSQREHNHTAHH